MNIPKINSYTLNNIYNIKQTNPISYTGHPNHFKNMDFNPDDAEPEDYPSDMTRLHQFQPHKPKGIVSAEPINDVGPSTKTLNKVIGNALSQITVFNPLVIANTNTIETVKYIDSMLSNDYIDNSLFVKNIMLIEDPRLKKDKPIVISRSETGDLFVNADDVQLYGSNHKLKSSLYKNYPEPLDMGDSLSLKSQGLMSIHINPENTNEYMMKKYVNQFPIEKFLDIQNEKVEEIKKPLNAPLGKTTGLHPVFNDIGGNKKPIEAIEENILFPMIYPEAFGHIMNKGAILAGPPGTGKTLIAKALANEIKTKTNKDVAFYSIDGTSLSTAEVGKTEENWRELFKKARENQPSIIFIDELESVSQNRDGSSNARFDNKTVNQLLTLMSDLEKSDDNVFLISATNKADILDSAMTRDGRLGVIIEVPAPNEEDCLDILQKLLKDKRTDYSLDLPYYAKKLHKMDVTGSNIAGLIERAEKISMRRNGIYDSMRNGTFSMRDLSSAVITNDDFNEAIQEEEQKRRVLKNKTNINQIGFNK